MVDVQDNISVRMVLVFLISSNATAKMTVTRWKAGRRETVGTYAVHSASLNAIQPKLASTLVTYAMGMTTARIELMSRVVNSRSDHRGHQVVSHAKSSHQLIALLLS